ncbi:transposase domain-containing protein [Vibrio splendidus]|uniref:transposase domain-containing protein n=1 Tax=Vibrio splendidus TaxID=29497 RepID=UPI000D392170|nr:hypothetical protein CWN84_23700 [Vibrio splendidus]PTP68766.1 hypothetical protein CWO23_15560 [Vibrio splendidus]
MLKIRVLFPELIEQCLQESGVLTIRKRRLPIEMMLRNDLGAALPLCSAFECLDTKLSDKSQHVPHPHSSMTIFIKP